MNMSVWFAVALVIIVACGIIWQKICESTPDWIKELDILGRPRTKKIPGSAIVCGGSISGMMTARILADHFERVIIVDPEIVEEKPKTRILQYNAAHVFLGIFICGARKLWPNFDEEMRAVGCRLAPADLQIHFSGLLLPTPYQEYPSDRLPNTLASRRCTVQHLIHRLFRQHTTAKNIDIVPGLVRGLVGTDDMQSIQSVTVRQLDGTQISLNDAALVVDCTGTTQAGLKWLKSIGFPLPDGIRAAYTAEMSYATVCFTVSPELELTLPIPEYTSMNQTTCVYGTVAHFAYDSCQFGLMKTDNNTSNYGDGSVLPRIASDVVPFLSAFRGHKSVPSWFLATLGILCERGNPHFNNIKIPSQSYVRYHLVPKGSLPPNFIAIGDAIQQTNPTYAQGFAKLMLDGIALNATLHSIDSSRPHIPRTFSAQFFKKNSVHTNSLWDGTRLHDYGFPGCQPAKGETRATGRLARWFELKLISAGTQDDEVASALWHVRHLYKGEWIILAPTLLWKVLTTPSRF
ncbi:hypothetical protein MSAN_01084900 [Mycena sanguinolenta]|uniref:Uncharacterized protein n=1 Tax=Mycena sanguinolenta TaxID=230812 RepID=A0A8H6YTW8_9AGAR|nr:hypothetical protein MSAN_01084900 [Mycena sanguinolenta]